MSKPNNEQHDWAKTYLLNRKQVRRAALELAASFRSAQGFNRVSSAFIDELESEVHALLRRKIHHHPSVGKTIMPEFKTKERKNNHDDSTVNHHS